MQWYTPLGWTNYFLHDLRQSSLIDFAGIQEEVVDLASQCYVPHLFQAYLELLVILPIKTVLTWEWILSWSCRNIYRCTNIAAKEQVDNFGGHLF